VTKGVQGVAFYRYKTAKGRKYGQIVENYRENGHHRQRVLYHVGPYRSLEDAIAVLEHASSWAGAYGRDYQRGAAQHLAQIRSIIAEHNVTYSEDEVRRLRGLSAGELERRNSNWSRGAPE
jgi:hypothetical protein